MKNRLFIIFLFVVLLAGNVFTLYMYLSLQKNASEIVSADQVSITNLKEEINIIRSNFRQSMSWQYQYEGNEVLNAKLLDQNGVLRNLHDVSNRSNVLIYRIPDTSCDACYDKVTAKLKEASEIVGVSRIIVIVPIQELRNTVTAFASQKINVTLLAAQEVSVLGILLETAASPFFFILGSSFKVSHLFIPHKNGVEITEDYLGLVASKFLGS